MKLISLVNFLLLPILLLATESRNQYIKVKIYSDNNITTARFFIRHPMIGDERSERSYKYQRDLEANYITHITAMDTDKILLDVSTSSYLTENLIFQHNFIDINQSKNIKYIITDNKKHQKEYSINTKKRRFKATASIVTPFKKESVVDYRKLNPKVFERMNIDEAIQELYGPIISPFKDKIDLSGPESTYCHESIPIHISSNVDLESLAIFNDKNKRPTIAIFSIPKSSIIDFKFLIKMFKTCTDYSIVVIGKDRNGNIYKTSTIGRIACADGCGGGG